MSPIYIQDGNTKLPLYPESIICCEGDDRYTQVQIVDATIDKKWRTLHVCKTLKGFEQLLDPARFPRISKHAIMSKDMIDSIISNKLVKVKHMPDKLLKIGAKYRKPFFDLLGIVIKTRQHKPKIKV